MIVSDNVTALCHIRSPEEITFGEKHDGRAE